MLRLVCMYRSSSESSSKVKFHSNLMSSPLIFHVKWFFTWMSRVHVDEFIWNSFWKYRVKFTWNQFHVNFTSGDFACVKNCYSAAGNGNFPYNVNNIYVCMLSFKYKVHHPCSFSTKQHIKKRLPYKIIHPIFLMLTNSKRQNLYLSWQSSNIRQGGGNTLFINYSAWVSFIQILAN